jgi:hypothetical protein
MPRFPLFSRFRRRYAFGMDLPDPLSLLPELRRTLVGHPAITAVEIGGSHAAGTFDRYSDVDLRVQSREWESAADEHSSLGRILGSLFLAKSVARFPQSILLTGLHATGVMLDVLAQPIGAPAHGMILPITSEPTAAALGHSPPHARPEAAQILQALTTYWVHTNKHVKALGRGLPLLCQIGIDHERALARDVGLLAGGFQPLRPLGIHSLQAVLRSLDVERAAALTKIVGLPSGSLGEMIATISAMHDYVRTEGRSACRMLSAAYPAELEARVLRTWETYLASAH